MTVRLKLALALSLTGVITALLVLATVVVAFQRFEHQTAWRRGTSFLARVAGTHDDLLDLHARRPDELRGWLQNMVLFEPDSQLYLLDRSGQVLAASGSVAPGIKVDIAPVLAATGRPDAAYVMGDDPERMDRHAVVVLQPVRRPTIQPDAAPAGYLYLVLHNELLPPGRWDALRMSATRPAAGSIALAVAATTALAVLIIVSVTRPLRRLTEAAGRISRGGLEADDGDAGSPLREVPASRDEFGQLRHAFEMMLATLRKQWAELRRLDHFRREGVSNLSHDLRSPLTATVTCLETLEPRLTASEDRRLLQIALRNTRNAARLVQSLGDLAKLDEPEFKLHRERVDVAELLDDIGVRFADRAARGGVTLHVEDAGEPAAAELDIQLVERAIANLVDNALKFCPPGATICLRAEPGVRVVVADTGPGIPAADLPHLFDRFYQSRHTVAPAGSEGGKGLGLAIVKRIAELHGGTVQVASSPGRGTEVVLSIPSSIPSGE